MGQEAIVVRAVIDKRALFGVGSRVGERLEDPVGSIVTVGKGSAVPMGAVIGAGAVIGTEVPADRVPAKIDRQQEIWIAET